MYLRIIGNIFSENIIREISALTNYGILNFQKVNYNPEVKSISIPIERCRIVSIKKIFFGTTTSFKYDKKTKIPALVTIRKVNSCEIENNLIGTSVSNIHLLFGIQIYMNEREFRIGSVEEDRGNICYSIRLKVDEIDIEINDINDHLDL